MILRLLEAGTPTQSIGIFIWSGLTHVWASKVNIGDLLRRVAPVLERQDWVKVKELTGWIRILRQVFEEKHALAEWQQNAGNSPKELTIFLWAKEP